MGQPLHRLSATIKVVDDHEKLLGSGRFSTDQAGYTAMRTYVKAWPERTWAIEGSNGAGRPLAQRLFEAGEHVVDVPAKLAARVRLFDTGHNRKTDARDAHSIAIVAVRTKTLRVLRADGELEAMRMLSDRRDELTRLRVQTVNRMQRLLSELVPGQSRKDLTALQTKAMLATVRPRDVAGKTRRRIAAEELADLDTDGRAYHRRKIAAGKQPLEALRCLKRRISDAVYRQLVADAQHVDPHARHRGGRNGPREGTAGRLKNSSEVDLPPPIDTSDQPLPGPAHPTQQPAKPTGKSRRTNTPQTTG